MKRGMFIEYLTYRVDLNVEVDNFGVNCAIGTTMTKWDLLYSNNMDRFHPLYNTFIKYASYEFKHS